MLVSDIINLAIGLTPQVDSSSYPPPTNGLTDFNIVYKQLLGEIKQKVNEDLYADFFTTTTTVAGQSEYSIPVSDGITAGMDQLLGVSIQYDPLVTGTGTVAISNGSATITGTNTVFTQQVQAGYAIIIAGSKYKVYSVVSDTQLLVNPLSTVDLSGQGYQISNENFYKARITKFTNLDRDESWYRLNQPQQDPFFVKYDTGVFIYPTPTVAVPMGLIMHGTKDIDSLGLSDTPILDDVWQYALTIGMRPFIFMRKGLVNEKVEAENAYQREIMRVLTNTSETFKSPVIREVPTLTQLQ